MPSMLQDWFVFDNIFHTGGIFCSWHKSKSTTATNSLLSILGIITGLNLSCSKLFDFETIRYKVEV